MGGTVHRREHGIVSDALSMLHLRHRVYPCSLLAFRHLFFRTITDDLAWKFLAETLQSAFSMRWQSRTTLDTLHTTTHYPTDHSKHQGHLPSRLSAQQVTQTASRQHSHDC
jgi:hypothetical protein